MIDNQYNDENKQDAESRIALATQWQLMWWRFRRHKLAMLGSIVIILFYITAIGAGFFAYSNPYDTDAYRALIPPQKIYFFDNGRFDPFVYEIQSERDPETFQKVFTLNEDKKIRVNFFTRGFQYKFMGLFPSTLHLVGVEDHKAEDTLFLLGTDSLGRDLFSRIIYGTRISLSIGLVGVILSLFLGVLLGGISGFIGGVVDTIIQRIIELLRSIPTIPLWLGLSAAVPKEWNIIQVYFAITIILSLISWTRLGRVVRGRFLSIRQEDFVVAAELIGASRIRIIFRHMFPSILSHIIAATTLALPSMIIAETALSFLGLGLRPPAISWGVLLQKAQNVQAVAMTPWLLIPVLPVVISILAFNFMGDGMRDAADPYS